MAVVLATTIGSGVFAHRQQAHHELLALQASNDSALTETALLAVAPRSAIEDLARAAQFDTTIIEPDGSVTTHALLADTTDGEWSTWRSQLRQNAERESRSFETVDPAGQRWRHHRVVMPDSAILVTATRVASPAPATFASVSPWLMMGGLVLAALGGVWWLLESRVARPASLLLSATEDLRVRGEIRPRVVASLDRSPDVPSEFARMGSMLKSIEAQSQQGFAQTEELLRAANVLGGSLDPETVLAAALQPLQRLLGNDRSAILQYNARTDRFEVVTARGHSSEWLVEISMTPASEAQASIRSIREGIPIQITDTESEVVSRITQQRASRHGYRSILAVPLTGELERPTTLLLQSPEPRAYSFDEIELSKSFGSIASAALRNAELFSKTDAKLQTQTDRLEAIVESVEQGLLVSGSDGRVLFANATMRHLAPSTFAEGISADHYLDDVLSTSGVPTSVRSDLEALEPGEQWLDIQITPQGTKGQRSFRVRKFVVRDAGGAEIGRGQTWTDVSNELELAAMKSGLLATVSHEFRTPLALIKGYATTLLADDVEWNESDQREFLQLVSGEADRLTELVQRILDMRRIDAGMVELQVMPTPIAAVIEAACAGVPQAADRLILSEMPPVPIDIDAARVSTVIRNLLDNACKYSPADQPVVVSAAQIDDEVVVTVRDFGRGIDDTAATRIFDTFVRGQSGLAAEISGVGLGLAISKGFVEAHGGRIWTERPADGVGSAFCIALPIQHAPDSDLLVAMP